MFFNKTRNLKDFSWLKRDIHSHLLPGIDDGSPDVDTSIALIRGLHSAGIGEFICTPHIIGDLYRNTSETINNALTKLRTAVNQSFPDVRLSAAAEYMLDDYFMELLHSNERLLTLKDNYILTEFSYSIEPSNIREISFEIVNAGYQPILAHPERYSYFHNDVNMYETLKDCGFLFQINLLSLAGYYGSGVKKMAKTLLKKKMVDFVGTDLHHQKHLDVLTDPGSLTLFDSYFGSRTMNLIGGV